MTSTRVPANIVGVLCDLAYGWKPSPMALSAIENLRFGDMDASELAQGIEVRENRLVARFAADIDGRVRLDDEYGLEGILVGDVRFRGRSITQIAESGGFSKAEGGHRSLTLTFADWTISSSTPPSLWVGRIEGQIQLRHSGNLSIERLRPGQPVVGARRHLCFSGYYRYYLVQAGPKTDVTWHLVIDAGTSVLDASALNRDFLALQFVLGRQLRMPSLVGISEGRLTVATTTGCSTRNVLEPAAYPPVPLERNNEAWIDECWPVLFFERISAAWKNQETAHDHFWMALEMYLDSMRDHLDGDYLRLQVALESFSYWVLRDETEEGRLDVKDKKAWKAWVVSNREMIQAHAVEGRASALYDKVMFASRLSSRKVVPGAFTDQGLELTSAMTKELPGRDTAVHQGRMVEGEYDADRELGRVALVRTMLVALIARTVGYEGAVNGWEVGPAGFPLEPGDWWAVSESARTAARHNFVAEENE